MFRDFLEKFNDTKKNRKDCKIEIFLLKTFKLRLEEYVRHAKNLSNPKKKENIGFTRIANNLDKILAREGDVCSCKLCESIGDVVIALEAEREMRLECTDYSFDHLCPLNS